MCAFPIVVSHSIPEGNALLIETPYGRVFHTGDWKLDEAPVLGAPSTAAALDAIGDKGVLALVCDSTNVFNAEASGSESSLRAGLLDCVASAPGRVLVTQDRKSAGEGKSVSVGVDLGGRGILNKRKRDMRKYSKKTEVE